MVVPSKAVVLPGRFLCLTALLLVGSACARPPAEAPATRIDVTTQAVAPSAPRPGPDVTPAQPGAPAPEPPAATPFVAPMPRAEAVEPPVSPPSLPSAAPPPVESAPGQPEPAHPVTTPSPPPSKQFIFNFD